MQCPKYILDILKTYNENGYEAYVVGGSVRDSLLGKECHDYDITTNALPEKTLELFEHCAPTGLKHGTVTILSEEAVEVTTYRSESSYKDHRHPDTVKFVTTLEEDLARRDFTINAIAYHPDLGIVDPYHGQVDLENKVIRCVGNPNQRFEEDALRMMRAYRFCAQLDFQLDSKTKQAIKENQALIQCISIERIRDELIRILQMNPYVVEQMVDLLEPIIPELKRSLECEQNSPWHYCNVLHHSLRAIKEMQHFDSTIAFTLLFHDLGKPETKTTDVNGRDHFNGHPEASFRIAKRICKELKLTSLQQKEIPLLVFHHENWLYPKLENVYYFRIALGWSDEMLRKLIEVRRCDILAHSKKGQKTLIQIFAYRDLYNKCVLNRPMSLKDLAIDGHDVIENTSYSGKEIHEVLEECLKMCFYDPYRNRKEYLIKYIKNAS